jgi:hypothetical protein
MKHLLRMASLTVGFTLCLSWPADAQNLRKPRFMGSCTGQFRSDLQPGL